ncbi:MAG: hypothetical protein DWQ34_20570 [Planctomycetota bacterium]|nr:MAG: hypothetical protein DWQ34_20570 [Planctomycetota bacterium]REK29754.1 MAG: hypothetical protein DWQ41_03725 [Planctomycetota bacterium]REK30425.1 MAG: hypothetical protein DWQ45_21310 [Planctomycetota bacterium]
MTIGAHRQPDVEDGFDDFPEFRIDWFAVSICAASVACFWTFTCAMHLSLKDMFGEPPPPETNFYFVTSVFAGLFTTAAGGYYIERYSRDGRGSGVGVAFVGLAILIPLLILTLVAVAVIHALLQ